MKITRWLQNIFWLYKESYSGLPTPIWMLSLVMLINRSGAMVIPFMTVYLTGELNFSLDQTGICLMAYGFGSVIGGYLGGYLSDKVGHFYVQFLGLILGGLMFLVIAYVTDFYLLTMTLMIASIVIECIRPANTTSIALYSRPEQLTRSFSLNRMAINLGFSIGPAVGGLIAEYSFKWIFYVDALTCIAAGLIFHAYFKDIKSPNDPQKFASNIENHPSNLNNINPWMDKYYLIFIVLTCLFGVIFFQLFNSLPLYYREVAMLSKKEIGALLGMNGFIVFLFEMVLVYKYGHRLRYKKLILIGLILCGISFGMLTFGHATVMLVLSMAILSMGEIFAMPFIASVAAESAGPTKRGSYMGLFTMAYAVAFMLAPLIGTQAIKAIGFDSFWLFIAFFSIVVGYGYLLVIPKLKSWVMI